MLNMNDHGIGRRGFLKAAAAVGTALAIELAINWAQAAERTMGTHHAAKNAQIQCTIKLRLS